MRLQHPQFQDVVIERDGENAERHVQAGWQRVDDPAASRPRSSSRRSRAEQDADVEDTDTSEQ